MYEIDETVDLTAVQPMIAKPFSPGNAFPADEVARERMTFDKAMIGSCTNGSYDDLLQAALVLRAARPLGAQASRARARDLSGIGWRRPADRAAGSAARRRIDRRGLPLCRRRHPAVVVRAVLRSGPGCAHDRPARHHVIQSQLAESHGPRRRGLPRQPGSRRCLGAPWLHGAAVRAGTHLGSGSVRRVTSAMLHVIVLLAALSAHCPQATGLRSPNGARARGPSAACTSSVDTVAVLPHGDVHERRAQAGAIVLPNFGSRYRGDDGLDY